MEHPPGLFARPLLGDVLKGLGIAALFAAVVILPQVLLPWHIVRWGMLAVCALMLWLIGFLIVRSAREHRSLQAENTARRAQRNAEDAAWNARPQPPYDFPGGKYGEGS